MLTQPITAPAPQSMPPVLSQSPELPGIGTFERFAAEVIGRAALSLAASRVAVDKAARGMSGSLLATSCWRRGQSSPC
jgi:hypothetical protein